MESAMPNSSKPSRRELLAAAAAATLAGMTPVDTSAAATNDSDQGERTSNSLICKGLHC